MGKQRKPGATPEGALEQDVRDQEVLRANRELAAYFKGRRTEREARAALKIIKAFVRDRERRDAKGRPPLPRARVVKMPKEVTTRRAENAGGARRVRKARATRRDHVTAPIAPHKHPEFLPLPESDERTAE